MLEVTPIPGASPYVLGVINYKSTIYPLIDLHQLLELRPSMPTRATRVVIINHERDPFAVLVDSTTEVREVRYSELTQRVESNQDVTQFVSTEINMSGKLLGVLNVEVIYLMIAGERPAGLGVL
jgi:purine-binding chemotaxis protein CheW